MDKWTRTLSGVALTGLATVAAGQSISVGTDSTVDVSYGSATQTAGPAPWSDLGVTATATVAPGDLNIATGGSTSFAFANAPTAGQQVGNGTVFNVNYTPGWTGSVAQGSASGSLSSSLVYNIGPISGSANLLNASVSSPASPTAALGGSLGASAGTAVNTSASGSGPGTTAGYSLSAQACAFVCVTLASASLGVTIGTQVQQSASVTPTVTYGDLVWLSTSPLSKYSASDPQAFIAGSSGAVANPLGNIAGLGLSKGQTFYYNILPEVQLSMAVTSQAQLSLPASLTASYSVLGIGGSQSVPLGNLYTLSTGPQTVNVDTTFHDSEYYSIKMDYEGASQGLAGPSSEAVVVGPYSAQKLGGGDDPLPTEPGPCAATPYGCSLTVPGGPGLLSGYGTQTGGSSLIPNDETPGGICAPPGTPNAGICINQVSLTGGPLTAPEIDSSTTASALTLLLGSLTLMRSGRGGRGVKSAAARARRVMPGCG
jgi:hypothetical protein